MSVDERADKYISHLTEEYAAQQVNISEIESKIAERMVVLGKTFSAANVYNDGTVLGSPMDSVSEKKRKLQEYLAAIETEIQEQTKRYSDLRQRAGELVHELDVKPQEMGGELSNLLVRTLYRYCTQCDSE